MHKNLKKKTNHAFRFALGGAIILALFGGAGFAYKTNNKQQTNPGDITGSISPPSKLGPSGLPLPRFVSLKSEKVNVRKGPSSDHALAWVYQKKGLPVEIIAEFETWRKVRDAEGTEGWILQNMLTGKRTALMEPNAQGKLLSLMSEPTAGSAPVAKLASGVLGDIKECDGTWCLISAQGYDGYVDQNTIWGAYPGEAVD